MKRLKAFVKISGNLIENTEVLKWLKKLSQKYSVAICIGGGTQINQAFRKNGFEIKFGSLGRITDTIEEKRLAKNILRQNQARIQALLKKQGIPARVSIPLNTISGVSCPINGDLQALAAYIGYDRIFVLTLWGRAKKKQDWFNKMAGCWREKTLSKVEVIWFKKFKTLKKIRRRQC